MWISKITVSVAKRSSDIIQCSKVGEYSTSIIHLRGGRGVLPIMAFNVEASLDRRTFSFFRYTKKQGFYELSFRYCLMIFHNILHDFIPKVQEPDAVFLSWYMKGVPFFIGRCTKRIPFLSSMVYKRVKGWTSGRRPTLKHLVEYPQGNSKCSENE